MVSSCFDLRFLLVAHCEVIGARAHLEDGVASLGAQIGQVFGVRVVPVGGKDPLAVRGHVGRDREENLSGRVSRDLGVIGQHAAGLVPVHDDVAADRFQTR